MVFWTQRNRLSNRSVNTYLAVKTTKLLEGEWPHATSDVLAWFGCRRDHHWPLAGCGGGSSNNEILIGEYSAMTGTTATFGQSTHRGLMMAV